MPSRDPLFDEALTIAMEHAKLHPYLFVDNLHIDLARACALVNLMKEAGVVADETGVHYDDPTHD